jgi:uncharacterized protein YjbJ (UPF0337 family)
VATRNRRLTLTKGRTLFTDVIAPCINGFTPTVTYRCCLPTASNERWRTDHAGALSTNSINCVVLRDCPVQGVAFELNSAEIVMDKDQIKGRIKEAKGKVKEVTGKVVGNKTQETKGKMERAVGKVQADYGDLKSEIKDDAKKGS